MNRRAIPLGDDLFVYTSPSHHFCADSLLLAEFAPVFPKDTVCDLGCGCGIIPLLLWRRGCRGTLYAVDRCPEAIGLLEETVLQNRIPAIRPLCRDLRQLDGLVPAGECDLVVSNPPYFPAHSGGQPESDALRAVRHESSGSWTDVFSAARRLLRFGGRFCVSLPPQRLPEAIRLLCACRLEPKRMRLVQHRLDSEPFVALIEARFGGKPGLRVEPVQLIGENTP